MKLATLRNGGRAGLGLKGRGAIGAVPERLQSGWGRRLLAVGNAVGAGVGVWECVWGRVRAGVLKGGYPPPSFKRFPGGGVGAAGGAPLDVVSLKYEGKSPRPVARGVFGQTMGRHLKGNWRRLVGDGWQFEGNRRRFEGN